MNVTVWISDGRNHLARTGEQPWSRAPMKGEEITFTFPDDRLPNGTGVLGFEVHEVLFAHLGHETVKCYAPDMPEDELQILLDLGFVRVWPSPGVKQA